MRWPKRKGSSTIKSTFKYMYLLILTLCFNEDFEPDLFSRKVKGLPFVVVVSHFLKGKRGTTKFNFRLHKHYSIVQEKNF